MIMAVPQSNMMSTFLPSSTEVDDALHLYASKLTMRDLLNPLADDSAAAFAPSTTSSPMSRKRPLEIRLPMARFQFAARRPSSLSPPSPCSTSSDDGTHSTVSTKTQTLAVVAPHQCRYRNGKCSNPRATKTNGQLHTLCAMHRERNIINQTRVDARRRLERTRVAKTQPSP
ncbi:Aste57867_19830 [Aphanomyces stellatus]|uniref:Aste57867_19830 protein n=1 Tax=Aphanomyces stellatus TaxID=120398 RepID=A0A485LEP6_9STRA|nr:hypothetical protein As57867_019765 [Aphanomyces stellatus]VFT96528.1 Aste57867_19830 [Aphanomyces stellatus]